MSYVVKDHFFHRAKKEQYLARAVYKLRQIQEKYRLVRPGDRVLDLGAAPGSWMQLTSSIVGPKGFLVGVDIKKIQHPFPANTVVLEKDIFEPAFEAKLLELYGPFDVVLSDMAPSTSGIRVADSARSALLFERALEIAGAVLKPGGHFLAKIFQGPEFHGLLLEVQKRSEWVKVIKPDATRKQRKEVYILAMRFRKSHEV